MEAHAPGCPGGVDHKWCCNPSHLRVGTRADNARDAATRGQINGRKGRSRTKLVRPLYSTDEIARMMRDAYDAGGTQRQLHTVLRKHGIDVSIDTVHSVVLGRTHAGAGGKIAPRRGARGRRLEAV